MEQTHTFAHTYSGPYSERLDILYRSITIVYIHVSYLFNEINDVIVMTLFHSSTVCPCIRRSNIEFVALSVIYTHIAVAVSMHQPSGCACVYRFRYERNRMKHLIGAVQCVLCIYQWSISIGRVGYSLSASTKTQSEEEENIDITTQLKLNADTHRNRWIIYTQRSEKRELTMWKREAKPANAVLVTL